MGEAIVRCGVSGVVTIQRKQKATRVWNVADVKFRYFL